MGREPTSFHVAEPQVEIELTAEEALYLETLDLERRVLRLEAENQVLRRANMEMRRETFVEHLRRKLDADLGGELILDSNQGKAITKGNDERDGSSW